MAKGKNSFDLDDELDFGDDFDLFNDEPLNLTRIQKTGAAAKGVGLGIRDAVFSVDWLVKTLDNAIPKSYGIDLTKVIDVKDSINELYSDAKEEAGKVNKEFKRTTREYSKNIIEHAPNRFKEKLEDYYRESEQRARAEVSEEDGFVTSGLMEMMTAQYAQSAEYHEEERDRQSKEAIVENQHRRQILGINESVRDNLERIASFNDRVTSNYQRNNLKLGLKQYFVLSKILEINRENARVTQDNLDAIYKEVAKPDLLKQKEHPDAQRYFARENRKGGMFGKAYDVVDRIRENALSMGKEKIQNISQATLASLGMLDMMSGMSSMGNMGNKYENYGRVAGEFLGGHLSNPISRAIRRRLERSPRSQELAKRSRFLTSNFRNLIEEESRAEDEWGDYGPKFNPRRLLARTLKGLLKDDTDNRLIERDDERTLQDAHPYTRQTHRTLNEVIPGLLSNIHGELVHMRTGKAISPLTFDFKANKFTSKAEARERLKGDLYLETGGDRVRQQTDSLLNQIGADNLSESDREDLAVFLMSQSRDRRLGSEERLTDVDTYADMDPGKAAQYANLFKTYFNDTDDKATRKFEFTDRYNRLMDSSTASRDYFNDLIRTGRSSDLEALGIIHNGRINDEALMRHYLTQSDDDIHIETREKIDAQRKEEEERERRKQEEIEGMARHINRAKEKFYGTRFGRRARRAFTKTGQAVEDLTDSALDKVEEVTAPNSEVRARADRIRSRIQKRVDSAKTDRGIDEAESHFDGDDDLLTNRFNEGKRETYDPEAIDAGSEYVADETATMSDRLSERLEGILRVLKTTHEYTKEKDEKEAKKAEGPRVGSFDWLRSQRKDGKKEPVFHGNKKHDEKDSSAGILKRGLGAIFSLGKKLLGGIGSTITGLVTSIFGNTLGGLVAAAGGALIKGAGGLLGAGAKALGGGIWRLLGMGGKGAAKGLGRIFGSVFNPAAGAGRAAKTGGFMGRILGGMGRGIGSVAKRIPGLGKGRAARGAGRLPGRVFNPVAGVGRAMGTVGTMGGLLKTGGVAAGKLAWGGLSMAGKAALPFLSGALANPFVLGAAAVGVGGYAAYKWFTRVTLNPLNQMRLVQYGFDAEDLDTLKKLMVIEEAFKPGVVFDGTGMPTIDDKVVDWQEIVKVTGINAQSEEELQALSNYLDHRFLPVYLVHASVRHRLEGDHDLKNVEKIDKEKIEAYVEGTAFSQGAYPTAYNPFTLPEVTVTNAEDVQYAVEAARAYATELANKKSLKEKAKDSVKGIGRGIKDGVKGIGGGIKGFFLGKEAHAAELVDPGEDLSKNPYLNPSVDDAETSEATDKELASQVGELVKVESGKKIPNFLKNVIKYSPAGLGIKAGGMIMERLKDTDITSLAKTALEYSPLGIANKVRNRVTELVEKSSTLSTIAGIADKVSPYGLAKRGLGAVSDRLKDTAFGRAAGEFKEGISETSIGRGIGNFFKSAKQFVVEGVTGKHRRIPKEIQALDAIRYKLYGLVTMEPNKLYQILDLEDYLDAGLRYGTERRAIWEGSIEEVVSIFSTRFSIDETDKERLSNLATWISSRFLPVFTSLKGFLNDVARTTKIEEGILKLNPLEKMELVRHLLSVTTILPETGDVSSVWGVTESPWANYELNTDASSVLTNVNVIESALRDYTVMEEKETKTRETERRKENKEGSDHIQINDAAKRNVYTSMDGNEVITTGAYSKASRESALLKSAGISAPMIQTGSYTVTKGVGGKAAELPDPVGDGSYDAYKDTIREAAKMAGVDEKTLAAMIAIESGFRTRAKAPTSTAKGLGQFLDGTWTEMIDKHGSKYGISKAVSQYDPKANILMTAEFIKDNMKTLGKNEYRPVDAYMAHFLGAGGYKKFLEAGNDAIAAQVVGPDAANRNRSIFYARDGRPKTVGEIISDFNDKLVTRAEDFGVNMRESVTTEPVPHNDVSGTVSKEMDGSNAMSRVTTEPVTPGVIGAAQAVAQATGAIFTNLNPYNTSTFTSSHQQNQRNQSAGGGIGGPISGKGIAGSAKDAKSFIETLDPKLIELGKRSTYPADSGVDIQGMNQDFMTIFYALVGEYVQKGGGKIQVNSAYRSVEKQRELYDRWIANGKSGGAVAKPGRSRHGSGIAIDINSKPANTMDSMGLLAKYQFHRPVRGEAWHLENYLFSNAKQTQDAINAAMKDSTKPKPSLVEEVEGGQALPDFKESDLLATPDEISASQSAHAPANAFGGLSDGSSGLRATPSLTGISLDAAEQLDLQHQAAANHPLQRVVSNGLEVAKQQLSVQQDIYGLMREMLTVMSDRQVESSVSQSSKEAHDTRKLPGDDTARGRVRDDYIPIGELPKPTVRMNRNI